MDKIDEMIEELEYSIEWHNKQLATKKIQLEALQEMKESRQ